MDEISRKRFLELCGGGALVVTVTVAGCDDGDGDGDDSAEGPGSGGGACDAGATASSISANHGHSLTIPASDIEAGVAKDYDIQGSSPHGHTVQLSANDFISLMAGNTIEKPAADDGTMHTHQVSISC